MFSAAAGINSQWGGDYVIQRHSEGCLSPPPVHGTPANACFHRRFHVHLTDLGSEPEQTGSDDQR